MSRKNGKPGYLTEFAKDRGITKQSAQVQLKRAGIDYSKPFDFADANRKLDSAQHAARAPFRKRKPKPAPSIPPTDSQTPNQPEPPSDPESSVITFLEAQRRKELANAQLKELEVRKRAGELIEVATVEATVFEKGRQTRDALLSLADRLAGILAPITDQSKVHEILLKEIHQALEALTGNRNKKSENPEVSPA